MHQHSFTCVDKSTVNKDIGCNDVHCTSLGLGGILRVGFPSNNNVIFTAILPWQLKDFWSCRFTSKLIGDELFGTYRVAHRIGRLFVVCSFSTMVCGYLRCLYSLGRRIVCPGIIWYLVYA